MLVPSAGFALLPAVGFALQLLLSLSLSPLPSAVISCFELSALRFSRAPRAFLRALLHALLPRTQVHVLRVVGAGCVTSTTLSLRALRVEILGSRAVVVAQVCDVARPLMGPLLTRARVRLRSCFVVRMASGLQSRQSCGVISTRERSGLAAVSAALGCVPRGQRAPLNAREPPR